MAGLQKALEQFEASIKFEKVLVFPDNSQFVEQRRAASFDTPADAGCSG